MGKQWKEWETLFLGAPKSLQMVTAAMKLRLLLLGRKVMTNLDSIFKSRDITLLTKVCLVKAMVFPVVMCGCESWTIKKAKHQRIDAFELWCWRRLLRVPWTTRRSNQSNLKEISPDWKNWCWNWNSDPWPPDAKSWLVWKDRDAGKDWRWEEKWTTEDEMVGCHYQLDGDEFDSTPGVGDGQGGVACCGPRCREESDTTGWLNWTDGWKLPLSFFYLQLLVWRYKFIILLCTHLYKVVLIWF